LLTCLKKSGGFIADFLNTAANVKLENRKTRTRADVSNTRQ
jgi:hypothetical protein